MKILDAMEIANCDFEHMEMAVLVGALLKIKQWDHSFERLKAEGKKSLLDDFRIEGLKVISEYEADMASDDVEQGDGLVLKIYEEPKGSWSGRLFCGDVEIGQCGSYSSPDAVKAAAIDSGILCDTIKI